MYTVEFWLAGMKGKWEHKFRTKKATIEFVNALENLAEKEEKHHCYNVKKNGEYIALNVKRDINAE